MPLPTLRRPNQPGPVQALLWLLEAAGSLYVAVVLLGVYAFVLAWATFVDHLLGEEAALFGFYHARWFLLLTTLLGLNVLASMIVRFPWKKRHFGFLITHGGILLMMIGCVQTFVASEQGRLAVVEGDTQGRAFKSSYHFELLVEPLSGGAGRRTAGSEGTEGPRQIVEIPFLYEPFSWEDYEELAFFPWHVARPDQTLLYDKDGIRLEVLDYWSDSDYKDARLVLKVRPSTPPTEPGESSSRGAGWKEVSLAARTTNEIYAAMQSAEGSRAIGESEQQLPGGPTVTCWKTRQSSQVKAFLNSEPVGPLGRQGQVVLIGGGRKFHFLVEEHLGKGRLPLGASGAEAELVAFEPAKEVRAVQLALYHPGESPVPMVLFADRPALNRQDVQHEVYGTFWYQASTGSEGETGEGASKEPAGEEPPQEPDEEPDQTPPPRIDVLVAQDGTLYYRGWDGSKRIDTGMLPTDGTTTTVSPRSPVPLDLLVTQPPRVPRHLPFDSEKRFPQKRPQVRLQLTVDGVEEEFWLTGRSANPYAQLTYPNERRVVQGGDRRVAVTMPQDVIDLGFEVKLHWFALRRDPGTEHPAGYTSLADIVEKPSQDGEGAPATIAEKVAISPNRPFDVKDPKTGVSFRLFQESYNEFLDRRSEDSPHGGESAAMPRLTYLSFFAVNRDPGRGLKYLGWLLIVVGTMVVFYMKLVLYRKRRRRRPRPYYTASHP